MKEITVLFMMFISVGLFTGAMNNWGALATSVVGLLSIALHALYGDTACAKPKSRKQPQV